MICLNNIEDAFRSILLSITTCLHDIDAIFIITNYCNTFLYSRFIASSIKTILNFVIPILISF